MGRLDLVAMLQIDRKQGIDKNEDGGQLAVALTH